MGNQRGQEVVKLFGDEFCRTIAGRDNWTTTVLGLMYFEKEIYRGGAGCSDDQVGGSVRRAEVETRSWMM